jgi:conjugal transfer mating pair stabilization protein TraN
LQENARGQLGLNWDSPKHANCRGLMIDEISHLDFSKMDFSELYSDYEKKLPGNFQSKLELLENRLKEKLREDDGNKA